MQMPEPSGRPNLVTQAIGVAQLSWKTGGEIGSIWPVCQRQDELHVMSMREHRIIRTEARGSSYQRY